MDYNWSNLWATILISSKVKKYQFTGVFGDYLIDTFQFLSRKLKNRIVQKQQTYASNKIRYFNIELINL